MLQYFRGYQNSAQKTTMNENYEQQTRKFYERRMMELEIRCFRAAVMNYRIASKYDQTAFYTEIASYIFGGAGAAVIGLGPFARCLKSNSILLGSMCMISGGLINIIANSTNEMFSSLKYRAKTHNTAAGKWQLLQDRLKTNRWRLQDPHIPMNEHMNNYDDLAKERKEIVTLADIPQKTYKEYEDVKPFQEMVDSRNNLYEKLKDSFSFPDNPSPSNEVTGKNIDNDDSSDQ